MMAGALKELKRGDLGHWVAKRAGEACRAVKFMDVTSRLKRGSRAEKKSSFTSSLLPMQSRKPDVCTSGH